MIECQRREAAPDGVVVVVVVVVAALVVVELPVVVAAVLVVVVVAASVVVVVGAAVVVVVVVAPETVTEPFIPEPPWAAHAKKKVPAEPNVWVKSFVVLRDPEENPPEAAARLEAETV